MSVNAIGFALIDLRIGRIKRPADSATYRFFSERPVHSRDRAAVRADDADETFAALLREVRETDDLLHRTWGVHVEVTDVLHELLRGLITAWAQIQELHCLSLGAAQSHWLAPQAFLVEHADEARADLRALPSIYEQLRRGGLANTSPSIVEQITAVLPNLAPTQPILDGVPSVDQLHALELSGSSLGFYARLKRAETVLCAIVAGLGLPHPVPEQFAGIDTEQVAPFVGSVPRLSLTEFKEMQHVIDAFQMPRSSHTASLRLVAYNVVALHGRLSLHLYERAALDRI